MASNGVVPQQAKLVPFWRGSQFRPMSDEAIRSLCDGDAEPEVMVLRGETLLIRPIDHQGEYNND